MVSIGVDPACLLISLIALWVAYKEIKRNRSVDLQILKFGSEIGQNVSIDDGKPYSRLEITLRNQGVALHNVTAFLTFRADSGGKASLPLRPNDRDGSQSGEFSCGMVSAQSISTYEMKNYEMAFLLGLQDVWAQEPEILIYSQGYLCKTIKIATWWERLRFSWNQFAWAVNAKIPVRRFRDKRTGITFVKTPWGVPTFKLYGWQLENFLRSLKSHYEKLVQVAPDSSEL